MLLESYLKGGWHKGVGPAQPLHDATSGAVVAEAANTAIAMSEAMDYARTVGGPALRRLSFHKRAEILKALAQYLNENKALLHELSLRTGATKADGMIDIEGGIATLFVYSSKGRRELPNTTFLLDGAEEHLSKGGSFIGQHMLTSLKGVAIHINAFNFPVWGLLEKFAPAFLAGVPVLAKPATVTSYLAEALAKLMVRSGVLPEGSFQFLIGQTGDMFEYLGAQDVVAFTGSASTAEKLRRHPVVIRESVRFTAEQDSLNAAILGPDAGEGTPEFDLFIKEVAKEMTVKAGQKCTAIRRILVPKGKEQPVIGALSQRLAKVSIGDPAFEGVRMGPLVGQSQREDVLAKIRLLQDDGEIVFGDLDNFAVEGADRVKGAFVPPVLLHCSDGHKAQHVHDTEAFGPVACVMGYDGVADAVVLANKAQGSLVSSFYTFDPDVAAELTFGTSTLNGRLVIIDRDCAKEQTGHGSPLPHMVHGGPGRAGGGEELGGIRAVHHYMQRTALQGSPAMLSAITETWLKGATQVEGEKHPFRYCFNDLAIGQSFNSQERAITLADIEHFAEFTGDKFYAHMSDEDTRDHPFFPGRVAHGYLLLAFAAGLFVDPERGPVLANYGLDNLRFMKPVSPGDAIRVRLTAKAKSLRNDQYGEVRWDVEITNRNGETVAAYELLTMNALEG